MKVKWSCYNRWLEEKIDGNIRFLEAKGSFDKIKPALAEEIKLALRNQFMAGAEECRCILKNHAGVDVVDMYK
jgi:hypothetical protein